MPVMETVAIQAPQKDRGYVIINKSDFDPKGHKKFTAKSKSSKDDVEIQKTRKTKKKK